MKKQVLALVQSQLSLTGLKSGYAKRAKDPKDKRRVIIYIDRLEKRLRQKSKGPKRTNEEVIIVP
ncbi:hypothetical protein ACJ64_09380, partial [Bacillus safensis]